MMMDHAAADRIILKRHAKEMKRVWRFNSNGSRQRERGNDGRFLEAVRFKKGMSEFLWCEWCLSTNHVELHHIIDRRHNLLDEVIFLCRRPCHLLAHDGCFANKSNQELCMGKPRWTTDQKTELLKLAGMTPVWKDVIPTLNSFVKKSGHTAMNEASLKKLIYGLRNPVKKSTDVAASVSFADALLVAKFCERFPHIVIV